MHEHTLTHSRCLCLLLKASLVLPAPFAWRCVVSRRSAVMFLCFDSFILGSFDKDDGPQLYMVDPSGISYVSDRLI